MEVEVKVKVDNLEDIRKKLIEIGAKFTHSNTQEDKYFKKPGFENRTQGPGDFVARIRKQGEKNTLTTKTLTEILGAWVEHETEIKKPEAVEKMLLLK